MSRHYKGLKDLADDINCNLSNDDVEIFLKLYSLLYADDTVILAENEEELQKALNGLEDYCNTWDLTVNLDKT